MGTDRKTCYSQVQRREKLLQYKGLSLYTQTVVEGTACPARYEESQILQLRKVPKQDVTSLCPITSVRAPDCIMFRQLGA
jgi:hypothetical protein